MKENMRRLHNNSLVTKYKLGVLGNLNHQTKIIWQSKVLQEQKRYYYLTRIIYFVFKSFNIIKLIYILNNGKYIDAWLMNCFAKILGSNQPKIIHLPSLCKSLIKKVYNFGKLLHLIIATNYKLFYSSYSNESCKLVNFLCL